MALIRRNLLKREPRVREAVERFWGVEDLKMDDEDRVNKQNYIDMLLKICRELLPPE